MRHVRAELPGQAQPEQGVEVGAVHVDLAAGGVDHRADLDNGLLEHAMGGGIGDHQRRQIVGVGRGLRAQVGEVDVAVLVAGHHLHRHARPSAALAGLVPWAELGIRQTLRPPSPRLS